MAIPHNRLHQFSAGINALNNSAPLLFDHPTQQGWKVYAENLSESIVRTGDAYWDINANVSGTVTAGDEHSLVITGNGSAASGYSFYRDFADIELTSATKKFYLETRVKYTNASSGTVAGNAWFVGWSTKNEAFTTGAATAWDGGNELIGFGHLSTDTAVSFVSREAAADQLISLGFDLTSGTYAKFACYYDGSRFNLYRDDVLISSTLKIKLNADDPMVFQVMFEAVEAKANTFAIQYALLAVEL